MVSSFWAMRVVFPFPDGHTWVPTRITVGSAHLPAGNERPAAPSFSEACRGVNRRRNRPEVDVSENRHVTQATLRRASSSMRLRAAPYIPAHALTRPLPAGGRVGPRPGREENMDARRTDRWRGEDHRRIPATLIVRH